MRAGRLRDRVRVERPVSTQRSSGAETITWSLVAVVWAQISPNSVRQRERLTGNMVLADMDALINMRWSPIIEDVNAKWRIVHGTTIYNIIGVSNIDMRNRELELQARVGDNNG